MKKVHKIAARSVGPLLLLTVTAVPWYEPIRRVARALLWPF